MSKWEPIESAPKDGSRFLVCLWNPEGGSPYLVCQGYWQVSWGKGRVKSNIESEATHWMPLPPPPSEIEGGV